MKNALIALGLSLAASTAAYADSGALDVRGAPPAFETGGAIDYTATASTGETREAHQARFGDGSPAYPENPAVGAFGR